MQAIESKRADMQETPAGEWAAVVHRDLPSHRRLASLAAVLSILPLLILKASRGVV